MLSTCACHATFPPQAQLTEEQERRRQAEADFAELMESIEKADLGRPQDVAATAHEVGGRRLASLTAQLAALEAEKAEMEAALRQARAMMGAMAIGSGNAAGFASGSGSAARSSAGGAPYGGAYPPRPGSHGSVSASGSRGGAEGIGSTTGTPADAGSLFSQLSTPSFLTQPPSRQ